MATAGTLTAGMTHSAQERVFAGSSENWSGYDLTGANGAFSSVTADWVVPTVTASVLPTYSASWVGIDGATNTSLIQTGTEADFVNGQAQYDAWWEILPAASTPVFEVSPGDAMTASVSKDSADQWTITITDTTSGQTFSTVQDYTGPGASAEWIQERPEVNGNLATLAKFTPLTFDDATVNGANPHLTTAGEIVMTNSLGQVLAQPSAPNATTDGFTVTRAPGLVRGLLGGLGVGRDRAGHPARAGHARIR